MSFVGPVDVVLQLIIATANPNKISSKICRTDLIAISLAITFIPIE